MARAYLALALTLFVLGINSALLKENGVSRIRDILREHLGYETDIPEKIQRDLDKIHDGGFLQCQKCKLFMSVIDKLFQEEVGNDKIEFIAVPVCIALEIEDPRVCSLAVKEWAPTVLFLLESDVFAASDICGIQIPGCGDVVIHKYPNWTLNFPNTTRPAFTPLKNPPTGTKLAKVLFLTDIHMDMHYAAESNALCGDPLCCRSIDGDPITPSAAAGKYGSLASCDTPLATFDGLLAKLAREKFDWVIMTGDLPAHDVYNQTKEDNLKVIGLINDLMYQYFPDTPVLNAIGNHEAVPVNMYIPPREGPTGVENPMRWLYQFLYEKWSRWLPVSTKETIIKGAYWSWEFLPNLKVISINSAYGQTEDWYGYVNNGDFAGMLQWMIDELQDAEDKGMRVWLMSHHFGFSFDHYSEQFNKVIQRYSNSISRWFNAHAHTESFYVYVDPTQENIPVLVAQRAPSVTNFRDDNSAYTVLYVDAYGDNPTYAVVDYEVYIMNTTLARIIDEPYWQLEYSARGAYQMEGLFPADYALMLDRMQIDPELATKYQVYNGKSTRFSYCDLSCANSTANGRRRTFASDP